MLIGLYRELSGKERKKGKERHIKMSFRWGQQSQALA